MEDIAPLRALVVEDEWPARNYLVELLHASKLAAVAAPTKIVARKKKGLVFLRPEEVWAFEAADRLTFVHTPRGKFDLDLSLSAIEAAFGKGLLRVHRNWLVNPEHVRELVRDAGDE